MSYGSRIFIAEAILAPSAVTWRVATGPGWASAGGQPGRWAGVMDLTSWGDSTMGVTAETSRATFHASAKLRRLALELGGVQPLPLGSMDQLS